MTPDQGESNSIQQHPWFPKTEPLIGGGSQSGQWQARDQETLGTIANNLVYEVASSRVNSLPSPWSRALQFEQAVNNDNYPTRADLLEELFGCLATVGLWEIYGVKLEAEQVSLRDYLNLEDDSVGPFSRSLSSNLPGREKALYHLADGSNPWQTIHVLRIDKVVVGFTSPTTVICPSVYLSEQISGMKWTAQKRFTSPTSFLSQSHRQALAAWLKNVSQKILEAEDKGNQTSASRFSAVVDGFIIELTGGEVETPNLSSSAVPNLPPRPTAVALLRRPARGGHSPSRATLALGDRRKRPLLDSPKGPVVLLDPEMPSKLGLPASEITLYEFSTLESVGLNQTKLVELHGGRIEVLTHDDIFLPELYLLPGEASLLNSWLNNKLQAQPLVNGQKFTPLLPLSERVRSLYSSEEICQACSLRLVQSGGGNAIAVTLMLPLEGQRELYPVSRSFPIKEQNLIDQDLPVITLWPNISDLNWKSYYIFCEDSSSGLTVDGLSGYDRDDGKEGQERVKYFRSERFPDLIKLIEKGEMRGLIPVNAPPPTNNSSDSWKVGIDFGTSFTNFFIDDGPGGTRKPLDTRLIPLTLAQRENQLNLLYKYFIPETLLPKGSNPPTSTALSLYGWQEISGKVPELFHQARVQWPSATANALRGSAIRTGFKWGQIQFQKPFLKELALLISSNASAAGAREVEWSVSYPSAFSPNEARRYKQLWENLCTELTETTGLRHQLANKGAEGGLETEAVAFAKHFGNNLNLPLVHTSCLDVGGGTTDISIWQENTLLHQVSIPFAGRDLCTAILQSKPSFIKFLFSPSAMGDIGENDAKLRQDRNFNSWLDNCIRYESEELLNDRLPIHRSTLQPQLQEFISLMAVGFGGLYHYLGLVLKALDREVSISRQAPTPVYLGGNGARFMNWLDESGSFSRGCESDQLMEALQRKSSGFTDQRRGSAVTTLSEAFKDETASGLISRGVNLRGDFDPRDQVMFTGEALSINGHCFGALERVVIPAELETIESYRLENLMELRQFVENYDEAIASCRISSLLPIRKLAKADKLWNDVEIQVRSFCLERVGKDVAQLEPEPGFILGLRALLHVLTSQWAERY